MKKILTKIATLWILAAQTVWAHSPLHHSEPVHGAVLKQSPEHIALAFGNEAHLVKLRLINEVGEPIDLSFKPMKGKTFTVPLGDSLSSGLYQVNWMIMGADAHKVKGSFEFSVSR